MPVTIKSQGSGASASCNALTGDASFIRPPSVEQEEARRKAGAEAEAGCSWGAAVAA